MEQPVNIDTIRAAVEELLRQGKTPSVRRVHALTGGSFRDVSRLLREFVTPGRPGVLVDGNTLELGDVRPGEVPSDSPHEAQDPAVGDPAAGDNVPVLKAYRCTRYPSLRVRHLKFADGLLETDDPREQELIEGSSLFGVDIFINNEF
jgi:hypothetical protein